MKNKIKQFVKFFVIDVCFHDSSNIQCCVQKSCLNDDVCLNKIRVSCNEKQ